MSESPTVFSLRLPHGLNVDLRKSADAKGRSLNVEILDRLASTFGPDRRLAQALDVLELPEVRRVRHGNTTQAVEHVNLMISLFEIERVVLAARADPLNDAVLILLLQTPSHVIVIDQSALSMARRPRMLEIQQVFKSIDEAGLLDEADYVPTLLPESVRELSAAEVAAQLLQNTKRLARVKDFLSILAPHGHFDESEYGGAKPSKPKPRKR